jgi:hypothetical protein
MPTWDVVSQATPSLHGVDALSPTDVWAVGDGAGAQATTVHFDGTNWTTIDAPVPSGAGATNTLASVDARATTDVWAVGNAEDVTRPMIEHWDGTSWHLVASPAPPANVTYVLLTVRARAAGDVWAGGYRYNSATGGARHALAEHWNGTSWRVVTTATLSAPVAVTEQQSAARGRLWAVGRQPAPRTNQSLIKWNGTTWTKSTSHGDRSARPRVITSPAAEPGFAH